MTALKSAYEHYKLVVSQKKAAGESLQQEDDEEMEDAKDAGPTLEEIRQKILDKYKEVLQKDKRSTLVEQNPPSRAYSSTCSLTTSK